MGIAQPIGAAVSTGSDAQALGAQADGGVDTLSEGLVAYWKLDEADPTKSVVNATIDTATVYTRNESRDKDLKENFFEVTKYPTMTFVSKSITRGADGKLQITGDFTLHGVTKPVTFAVDGPTEAIKDPWGNQRRGASATATIHRSDFGITKYPGVIGEEIAITLDIEFIKK